MKKMSKTKITGEGWRLLAVIRYAFVFTFITAEGSGNANDYRACCRSEEYCPGLRSTTQLRGKPDRYFDRSRWEV